MVASGRRTLLALSMVQPSHRPGDGVLRAKLPVMSREDKVRGRSRTPKNATFVGVYWRLGQWTRPTPRGKRGIRPNFQRREDLTLQVT